MVGNPGGVETQITKKWPRCLTLTFDPATTPKIIDFKIEAGSDKDSVYEGINELKICASIVKGSRPEEFKTKAGSNRALFVLKREKQ